MLLSEQRMLGGQTSSRSRRPRYKASVQRSELVYQILQYRFCCRPTQGGYLDRMLKVSYVDRRHVRLNDKVCNVRMDTAKIPLLDVQ